MAWTFWIGLGAILGGMGVGLGAFGAHGLKDRLTPEYLAVFETGVRYHMYHVFALLTVGLIATRLDSSLVRTAGICFTAGIVLFSGSLYGLTLSGLKGLGMITPIGGLFFLIGWFTLAYALLRI